VNFLILFVSFCVLTWCTSVEFVWSLKVSFSENILKLLLFIVMLSYIMKHFS
jgi:hypothetical protein